MAFGGTAKTATLNSTSSKSLSSLWVGYKLNLDVSSKGPLTWCEVTGTTDYEFKVIYTEYNQKVFSGDTGTEKMINLQGNLRRSGKYSAIVTAYGLNYNSYGSRNNLFLL